MFFGLGIIGALLPIIPTAPFMLLALWAFSHSSERLESWLLHHRHFGPPLQRWRAYRVIPLPAKLFAWGSMAASLTGMIVTRRVPWPGVAVTAALMAYAVWFVARCPSRPPGEPTSSRPSTPPGSAPRPPDAEATPSAPESDGSSPPPPSPG